MKQKKNLTIGLFSLFVTLGVSMIFGGGRSRAQQPQTTHMLNKYCTVTSRGLDKCGSMQFLKERGDVVFAKIMILFTRAARVTNHDVLNRVTWFKTRLFFHLRRVDQMRAGMRKEQLFFFYQYVLYHIQQEQMRLQNLIAQGQGVGLYNQGWGGQQPRRSSLAMQGVPTDPVPLSSLLGGGVLGSLQGGTSGGPRSNSNNTSFLATGSTTSQGLSGGAGGSIQNVGYTGSRGALGQGSSGGGSGGSGSTTSQGSSGGAGGSIQNVGYTGSRGAIGQGSSAGGSGGAGGSIQNVGYTGSRGALGQGSSAGGSGGAGNAGGSQSGLPSSLNNISGTLVRFSSLLSSGTNNSQNGLFGGLLGSLFGGGNVGGGAGGVSTTGSTSKTGGLSIMDRLRLGQNGSTIQTQSRTGSLSTGTRTSSVFPGLGSPTSGKPAGFGRPLPPPEPIPEGPDLVIDQISIIVNPTDPQRYKNAIINFTVLNSGTTDLDIVYTGFIDTGEEEIEIGPQPSIKCSNQSGVERVGILVSQHRGDLLRELKILRNETQVFSFPAPMSAPNEYNMPLLHPFAPTQLTCEVEQNSIIKDIDNENNSRSLTYIPPVGLEFPDIGFTSLTQNGRKVVANICNYGMLFDDMGSVQISVSEVLPDTGDDGDVGDDNQGNDENIDLPDDIEHQILLPLKLGKNQCTDQYSVFAGDVGIDLENSKTYNVGVVFETENGFDANPINNNFEREDYRFDPPRFTMSSTLQPNALTPKYLQVAICNEGSSIYDFTGTVSATLNSVQRQKEVVFTVAKNGCMNVQFDYAEFGIVTPQNRTISLSMSIPVVPQFTYQKTTSRVLNFTSYDFMKLATQVTPSPVSVPRPNKTVSVNLCNQSPSFVNQPISLSVTINNITQQTGGTFSLSQNQCKNFIYPYSAFSINSSGATTVTTYVQAPVTDSYIYQKTSTSVIPFPW